MIMSVVYCLHRYLRGGDHRPFLEAGYPAARFTKPHEDFAHQHQDVGLVNQATVDLSKDDVIFGIRAKSPDGIYSLYKKDSSIFLLNYHKKAMPLYKRGKNLFYSTSFL